ncbi:hypothetical protein SUGI_0512540 [Cryptomeria japonica]|nr:hypothetical protein SUGI_0512540 [Cryptomeria japonica]
MVGSTLMQLHRSVVNKGSSPEGRSQPLITIYSRMHPIPTQILPFLACRASACATFKFGVCKEEPSAGAASSSSS